MRCGQSHSWLRRNTHEALTGCGAAAPLQYFGWSEEAAFTTAPEPDADGAEVALLALADLGHCEEDGAMSWPGSHANAVSVLPVGTDAEVQAEVCAQEQERPALTLQG